MPSGLSFRHGRARPTKLAPPERRPARLSFRRRSPKPARAQASAIRRLSFGRRSSGLPATLTRILGRIVPFRRSEGSASGDSRPSRLQLLLLRRRARAEQPEPPRKRTAADPLGLTARLVALGFAACMLQFLVFSQISILGVSWDVAPLVVAAAGFLCGSLPGAVFGFAVGLFIDLAFVQVLGISSLLFTFIGYGAGRLRELRAPEAPLTRLGLGAAATALALTGYGAIEFMLGVNTPVSYGLAGAIVKTTLLNSLIAIPVYSLTRRSLIAALPSSERLLDRQPPAKGGLSPLSRT